jgi:hypothetical protein
MIAYQNDSRVRNEIVTLRGEKKNLNHRGHGGHGEKSKSHRGDAEARRRAGQEAPQISADERSSEIEKEKPNHRGHEGTRRNTKISPRRHGGTEKREAQKISPQITLMTLIYTDQKFRRLFDL